MNRIIQVQVHSDCFIFKSFINDSSNTKRNLTRINTLIPEKILNEKKEYYS